MDDKVLLREWEDTQQSEYYQYVYSRINLDRDVLHKFRAQGEIIKMLIGKELTNE